jgi:succinyl-diaminopimelate desuccinylase
MNPREIAEKVTAEELREMTQLLVRTPSLNPPGDVKACAQVIGDLLAKEGIPVEQLAVTDTLVNVIATLEGRRPGKTLWYNGHMDVVPAGSDWTRDPWGGEHIDGKIYGRGASDMKGGLAAMIGSMLALKRAKCPFNGKIVFTAVADEETGSDNGTVWLIEHNKVSADYAIVGEPSDGWVAIGNRGVLWLEATLKGKASHASRPDLGVNAIEYAAKAITALGKLELSARQEIFQIPTGSLAVTLVNGGTKVNMIPDRCTITMDRRMLPAETVQEITETIRQTLAELMGESASFELRVIKAWPPVLMDQDHPLVTALMNAFEVVFRRPPEVRGKAASTDASFIRGLAGVPVVLYGPGLVTLAHMADEYVEVQALVRAAHIYTFTALDLLA